MMIVLIVSLLIFFNAMYVAAEFATVSARRTRVSQMAGEGDRMAQQLLPIMENSHLLDNYVAACQIGITISSLAIGVYGENQIAPLVASALAYLPFGMGGELTAVSHTIARFSVLAFITTLQVIMGELFPKSIAVQYPERVARALVVPMRFSLLVLRPLIFIFNGSATIILRLTGHKSSGGGHGQIHSPEEIELLVTESYERGDLAVAERQMVRNAFRMRELTARQIMLHRTRITAVGNDCTIREILNLALKTGFSRIPIYRETVDDIIGFTHVKDLFRLHVQGKTMLEESDLRKPIYVPESMPAADVWSRLNTSGEYFAVVFDEYGGTAGLITYEDLIEEIFGELQDEFDDEMALIARDPTGRIYLRGDLLITDVNEYLQLELPDDNIDSMSGLIFSTLGRAPTEKEEVLIGDVRIRVEEMEDLGIAELSLKLEQDEIVEGIDADIDEWEVMDHD